MRSKFINPQTQIPQQLIEVGITKKSPKPPYKFFLIAVFCIFAMVSGYLIFDDKGNPELSPERKAKRDAEIEGIKRKPRKEGPCEVYALIASENGL